MINSDMTYSTGRLIPEIIGESNELDYPEYPYEIKAPSEPCQSYSTKFW